MIYHAEAVFNGHPDKFCDQVADRIIAEAYRSDPEAYGQVEVGVWSDSIWLSGGTMTRRPLACSVEELVHQVGFDIGYAGDNHINVAKYRIANEICLNVGDPTPWTHKVNDQSIVIGWAGYNERTHFLPPEQFLVHTLRQQIVAAFSAGAPLAGQGPDGKLLVRLREEGGHWILEHVLVTLQQHETARLLELGTALTGVLQAAYESLQVADSRWSRDWDQVELLINPNGPLLNGGSDGDNGQTGRKLVMDYYGPRIPLGGGALSGKDLSHIDRAGAYAARQAAVLAVSTGAASCMITLAYAPNSNEPLDVTYQMTGRGQRMPPSAFSHSAIRERLAGVHEIAKLGMGTHFFDRAWLWNQPPT